MKVYELKDCIIRFKGTDEYIQIEGGKIFIHCPEWENPSVLVALTQLKSKPGFHPWEKEGYQ